METYIVVWNRNLGDVFVNDEQVSQLCFDEDSVGFAFADYLANGNQFEVEK